MEAPFGITKGSLVIYHRSRLSGRARRVRVTTEPRIVGPGVYFEGYDERKDGVQWTRGNGGRASVFIGPTLASRLFTVIPPTEED